MYILPSTLTEEEAPQRATKITELLQGVGGSITQEIDLGKKKLAYPINHDRYGYYRLVEFTAEPSALNKLNESLRLSRELLRHMIIDKPVKSQMVIEREQALKEKLAARRQRDHVAQDAPVAKNEDVPVLSAEEIDKKLDEIIEEEPQI